MQTAKQLTASAQSEIASRRGSPTPTTTTGWTGSGPTRKETIQELVNRAFTRLEAIYPRTWRTSFTTDDMVKLAKREVASSMAKWKTLPTPAVLDAAIERIKAEGSDWPPSIARLVKAMKPKPEDFGMPELQQAFFEARAHAQQPEAHQWSHEGVRQAGAMTGWWDLANATSNTKADRLLSIFRASYESICNRVMAGEPVEPRALIGSDGQLSASEIAERNGREQAAAQAEEQFGSRMSAEQGLAALRALVGGAA
ncbi:replication protein P [Halomonas sp. WWR20]